jgi:hypothetical protein
MNRWWITSKVGMAWALVLGVAVSTATANPMDDIWHTRLVNELGADVPTGVGIVVSQVESADGKSNYRTWIEGDEMSGKNIVLESGGSGASNHAGAIATTLFGNRSGIASGVVDVHAWETEHWLGASGTHTATSFLKAGQTSSTGVPKVETADVQNNSWVGSFSSSTSDIDAIRRLDYSINRDNYVSVVGLNNGSSKPIPKLLAHSYNAISVGLTSGGHSQGVTAYDGIGRTKPDLVAPYATTSGATAAVSGVSAILLETAGQTAARNTEVVKAALLAGATKHELADWTRTTTRPLNAVYGAGELNAYRSHQIVAANEQSASANNEVDIVGWDFVANPAASQHTYFFSVDEQMGYLDELSVALTWNRVVTDGISGSGFGSLQSTVADLSLQLFEASNFTLGSSLQLSDSSVDNVEHIYRRRLEPGQYALRVSGAAGTDFALAWLGTDFGLMGDLNLDGIVDNDDVDAFVGGWGAAKAFGTLDTWRRGDMNQDGLTDFADFVLLRGGLNLATGAEVSLASLLSGGESTIPEPRSLITAGIAMLMLLAIRLRTARQAAPTPLPHSARCPRTESPS